MELTIANELLYPLRLEGFHLSAYWVINISMACICSVGIGVTAWRTPVQMARPAYMMAALVHLIFQWPLAFFSPTFERSLADHWFFAASVHVPVVASLLWVAATHRLTGRIMKSADPSNVRFQNTSAASQAILLTLFAGLTILYVSIVGWQCTGLYAMLFDPKLALLAREASGKYFGTGLASYGHGVLANVVCPLVMYFTFHSASAAFARRQVAEVIAWVTTGIFALLVILLPGAKGSLIPTVIVVGVGIVAARKTWTSHIVVAVSVFGAGFLLLSVTDVLWERQIAAGGCYDFGACVSRHGACTEANTLLQSLRYRDMSLGLPGSTINYLEKDLQAACAREHQAYESWRCSNKDRLERLSSPPTAAAPGIDSSAPGADSRLSRTGRALSRAGEVANRLGQYGKAMVYRIGVVPVQVAGWHHLYVTEHGSPGIHALPISSVLSGQRIVMPILVYRAYYHLYSGGDRTSTGTAPTSFLLAYPAYLGLTGMILSLAAMFIFDLAVCMILRKLTGALCFAGIGLMVVACMNFATSDYGTTLLSHGATAALLVLLALSYTERNREPHCS